MVVAAQVQKAVNKKDGKLAFEGGAELLGLPLGDGDRDDHIPQLKGHPGDFAFPLAHLVVEPIAFEREDVGGAGLSAEFLVEAGHLNVVDEAHRDLGVLRAVLLGEHEVGKLGYGDARDEVLFVFAVHFDVHGNLLAALSVGLIVGGDDRSHERVAHDVFARKAAK